MSPLERFRYIRTLRMPAIPKAILWCVASHANRDGLAWPSRRLLAEESGYSSGSVYNGLAWLSRHGLLIQRQRPGHASTIKLMLEGFQQAATTTPSPGDTPPRHPVTTEVVQLKRKARGLVEKAEPRCPCGSTLGDGRDCITCHKFRESHPGIARVLPTSPSRLPVP